MHHAARRLWQFRRGAENSYVYQEYPNGNPNGTWDVGDTAAADDRFYTVVSTQAGPDGEDAGVGNDVGPSGTGTGIVAGGVTFDYLQENDLRVPLYFWAENCCGLLKAIASTSTGSHQTYKC